MKKTVNTRAQIGQFYGPYGILNSMSTEDFQPKFIVVNDRKPTWTMALRITVIYLIFSLIWIWGSDTLVQSMFSDPFLLKWISIFKGTAFVIISAAIIFFLVAPALHKLSDNEQVIRESRNELKVMLYLDLLTGLSNRRKLMERLPPFLNDSTNREKALLYIDVDNIKLINDTMGHLFGDALLTAIARRLSSSLRTPDEIYRLDGDEFVILTAFTSVPELTAKANSILALFEEPLSIEKTNIHSSISVGIAMYPLHGTDPHELLKFADIAMFRSKQDGKNRARLFSADMMGSIKDRMNIGEYLHGALMNNELSVHYQPQIAVSTRKVVSFEALIRWNSPVLGNVSPDRFISVAEETHMIIPIGEWVLWNACKFLKKLHTDGYTEIIMSVNISMLQLLQNDFVPMIRKILEETGIPANKLELELTESILMESWQIIGNQLDKLRELGIGIALDDFGKGYSSLSYLHQLPISVLKIDKIFIDGIHEANQDNTITGNIVRIGKKLGLEVIAEGVENEAQFEYLAVQQCDRVQGWLFSKALPELDALAYTHTNLRRG